MSSRLTSRVAYLFTGLPLTLLCSSIVLWRLTPALSLGYPAISQEKTYAAVLLGLLVFGLIGSLVFGARRAARLGRRLPWLWGALTCVPLLGIGVAGWLMLATPEEASETDAWALAGRLTIPTLIGSLAVAYLSSLLSSLVAQLLGQRQEAWLIWTTLLVVPVVVGAIAGFQAGKAGAGPGSAVGAALCTLLGILTLLTFATLEGVVCVIMAAPFAAVLFIIGGLIGHALGKRTRVTATQVQCAGWLLTFAFAAGEVALPPSVREDTVSSEIVIEASPEAVWRQLADLRDLPAPTEPLFVLGVAHPVGTTLEAGGGVGARRVCRLSTGDMPEVVTVWKPNEELRFAVLDTPAPMREATLFGRELDAPHLHGTYASLDGGFHLEPLPGGRTRLIGSSRYLLRLAPTAYWNLWTREIVSQVQQRVLRHVKTQAEAGPKA